MSKTTRLTANYYERDFLYQCAEYFMSKYHKYDANAAAEKARESVQKLEDDNYKQGWNDCLENMPEELS